MVILLVIFLIVLLLVIASCNASLNAYQPTVDTAVNRSLDTVDRVIDKSIADDPLADAIMVHNTVTSDGRVWMVVAFMLITAVVIAAILGYITLRTKQAEQETKLVRAQTSQMKTFAPPSQPLPNALTAQRPLYLPLHDNDAPENNESWTQ